MGHRRRARECALQLLYQREVHPDRGEREIELFWSGAAGDPEAVRPYAERLLRGVEERQAEIDRQIVGALDHWRLERVSIVDRNLLRLAVFELVTEELDAAIVIDEAIEIARKFGGDQSARFVNGVLDGVRRTLERDGRAERESS